MSPSTLAWRPAASKNQGERRHARSDDPSTAAQLYLDGVRRRCVVDAVVVADARGHVVAASTGSAATNRELAETGASIARGAAGPDDVDVYAHRIALGEGAVLVSSGSRVDRVRVVAADLARILG